MSFITAPTVQQRREIENLYDKGLSSSYVSSYVQAPLQAINVLAVTLIDIPRETLRGCWRWSASIITGKFSKGAKLLGLGILDSFRSIFQIAIIVMSVAFGILFPRWSYSALKALNGPSIAKDEGKVIRQTFEAQLREMAASKQEVEEARSKIESANQELEDLKKKNKLTEQTNTELDARCTTLRDQLEQKEGELSALNGQILLLRNEAEKTREQFTSPSSPTDSLEQTNVPVQQATNEWEEKYTSLQRELAAKEKDLSELSEAQEKMKISLQTSDTKLRKSNGIIKKGMERDARQTSEIDALKKKVLELETPLQKQDENKENETSVNVNKKSEDLEKKLRKCNAIIKQGLKRDARKANEIDNLKSQLAALQPSSSVNQNVTPIKV